MKKQEDDLMDIREVMMEMKGQKFDTPEEKIRAFPSIFFRKTEYR